MGLQTLCALEMFQRNQGCNIRERGLCSGAYQMRSIQLSRILPLCSSNIRKQHRGAEALEVIRHQLGLWGWSESPCYPALSLLPLVGAALWPAGALAAVKKLQGRVGVDTSATWRMAQMGAKGKNSKASLGMSPFSCCASGLRCFPGALLQPVAWPIGL